MGGPDHACQLQAGVFHGSRERRQRRTRSSRVEPEEFIEAMAVAHKNYKKLHFKSGKTGNAYATGYATDFDHNYL